MSVELGTVVLDHLTEVRLREKARIKHHAVPGMAGELAQIMGRPSVEVTIQGIFYGEKAAETLKTLRDLYLKSDPVDFFAEAKGEGYFAQVLITALEVTQRAGYLDEFSYRCELAEYVKPPSAAASPMAAIDTELAAEAGAFMDSVQDSLGMVKELESLMAGFENPVTPMAGMAQSYTGAVGEGVTALTEIANLLTGGGE